MTELHQIQGAVAIRAQEIAGAHGDWPCRKGCDDCCRSLASVPLVTRPEWQAIATALAAFPVPSRDEVRRRIQGSASAARPVTCPLLDTASGACLIYDARPVACRAYGFYAERRWVLGCGRIEAIGRERPTIIWGNHETLEERLRAFGDSKPLYDWLASD